jgi:hypothetical protein
VAVPVNKDTSLRATTESPKIFWLPQARMKNRGGLSSVEWPLRRCII